ncbi:MAG TPA: tRNA uridine-5-carboxymethylaminomethyl(34) synthesis GTPase MnmE [Bacilli bacterium]|nr:tRNA uridine-5-carboxymethylaminomethyl(34) synthesis GTPase MnmE [Bacilli bacterium]
MNDTIAMISTPLGSGGISIIRISGQEALIIVNKLFRGKDLHKVASHTIHYGHIVDKNEVIDEVLVSVMKAPKTYTREDVVEISCHGGVFVTNKILEMLLVAGARLAEPGEFTKRAFLNGRIDLTQAESIMDIIEAKTKTNLKIANLGLRGDVKRLIDDFRSRLLTCMAKIEVNIDYPEYEDEEQITIEILKPTMEAMNEELESILNKCETSRIIKEGIKTVIIGKPNVGKSSLLNALLREEKAIVTDIAGTTRDIVEGKANIGGIILNLIDTAGIRDSSDVVEKIGIKKTKEAINMADLIILVFDNSTPLDDYDRKLLELTEDKRRIIVINKQDLQSKINLSEIKDYILLSSFNEKDIEKLENKIKEECIVGNINEMDASYIGNARQVAKLKQAKKAIEDSLQSIKEKMPIDIVSIDIKAAWHYLGEITGDVATESLINELFSKFCLGK